MSPDPPPRLAPSSWQSEEFRRLACGAGRPRGPLGHGAVVALAGYGEGPASLEAVILSQQGAEERASLEARPHTAEALLGYAPLALVEGAWLQSSVQVERSHDELGAACLDALHLLLGEGDSARHAANRYRAQLGARGLALPPLAHLPADGRLAADDFALALPALRIGLRPDCGPEAAGVHAVQCLLGPPPPVGRALGWSGSDDLGGRSRAVLRRLLDAQARASGGPRAWLRVWDGAALLLGARRAWLSSLGPRGRSARTPWEAAAALVASKAPYALGAHQRVRLGDRTLEEWLDPAAPDLDGLLSNLARSRWVLRGDPAASPLLRATEFGGPMFGVFTADELDVWRAWIQALSGGPGAGLGPGPSAAHLTPPPARTPDHAPVRSGASATPPPLPLPELYHRLLRRRDAETDAHAQAHVAALLASARGEATPQRLAERGLAPYAPERLESWVHARMREQLLTRAPEAPPEGLLRRDEVVWLLTQLAPAALVDGAWLAGAVAPGLSASAASALLVRIYRDELGAGVPRQHHGNVMRATLAAHGVELPDCDTRAFVERRDLLPEAFSTPVLWLALARQHAALLPEVLGCNLAIEMAGVGGTYARATALLREHGLDPYFFQLHDTIDNASTGHTAWSVQAIVRHLEEVEALGGAHLEAAWRRVWQGHALYALSSEPLVRAVVLRLGPRLGVRWLGSQAARLQTLPSRLWSRLRSHGGA